jgi:FkbM family methyltransferase
MVKSDSSRETTSLLGEYTRQVLAMLEINCVLDVGAWKGDYAKFLRYLGYEGRIISFEPIRELYATIREMANADAQWTVYRLALGSENALMDFNVSASSDLSSFLAKNEYSPAPIGATDIVRVEKIKVRRLDCIYDDVMKGIVNPRILLKMDTQGYDLEVVKGAEGCLQQILGLQSEVSVKPLYRGMPGYLDALREYHALGFNLVGFFDVIRDSRTLNIVEYDCLMVRNDQSGEKSKHLQLTNADD